MDFLTRYDTGVSHPALDVVRSVYRFQREFQYWSPEQIAEHQLNAVKNLVSLASRTVPLYRRHFGGRTEISTWQQFWNLPITTRKILVETSKKDRVSTLATRETTPILNVRTSGSTAEPVHFARSARTDIWRTACKLIEYEWMDLDPKGTCLSLRFDRGNESDVIEQECWENGLLINLIRFGKGYEMSPDSTGNRIGDFLQNARPDYIYATPTLIASAAPYIGDYQAKLLFSIGEQCFDFMKVDLKNRFGAKVIDMFGANEIGRVAMECQEGSGFHVHDSNLILEIVDENFQPAGEGETGQVLLTSLQNPGMPIIRYQLGDMMTRTYKPCECGRGLSRIQKYDGRMSSRILVPGGKICWVGKAAEYIDSILSIPKYRLRQKSYTDFVLELTPEAIVSSDQIERFRQLISDYANSEISLTVSVVGDIPAVMSGKRHWFLVDFQPE